MRGGREGGERKTGRGGGDDVRIQENREGERRIRKGK